MSTALIAPGRVMLSGPGRAALWRPLRGTGGGGGGTFAGPYPNAITGISGWWDAGTFDGLLDASARPLPAWNNPAASVADKSGAGNALAAYRVTGSTLPQATPRLNGLLGGVGLNTVVPPTLPQGGYYLPQMDTDQGFRLATTNLGSATGWTWYLVWSRPNWRQGVTGPITLLGIAGAIVLQADGVRGAGDRLMLFSGAGAAVLTASLDRRHTHSIVIRNTPGAGVDVWLDGTQVATAVANPLGASASGALFMLHSGVSQGGAQCWFHEAASWPRALAAADIATLLACATRWQRGARKGVMLLITGQSNAVNYALVDGAAHMLAQGVAWFLGALAYNVFAAHNVSDWTMVAGHGIYDMPGVGSTIYPGSFVADPHDGSQPATWQLGSDGLGVQSNLAARIPEDLAECGAIVWIWSETDSYRAYSEKSLFKAGAQRFMALQRAMLPGGTAANMPLVWWNAIPYGNTDGVQMHREVVAELAADATQGVIIGNPMTADSNARTAGWVAATGVQTGGDNQHRDQADNQRFAQLAAPIVARALQSLGRGDAFASLPGGIAVVGGPRITHAYRQDSSTVILTVAHDIGTDLVVPLLAASGQGFVVMDGGTVSSPGTLRQATACARIDATHLRLTLASPLVNASASCLLFYPYGSFSPSGTPGYTADMGRGNAVYDNAASLPKPVGWDIGGDLGTGWNLNFPLTATTAPMALSDSPE
jgi:hypothetical protein